MVSAEAQESGVRSDRLKFGSASGGRSSGGRRYRMLVIRSGTCYVLETENDRIKTESPRADGSWAF